MRFCLFSGNLASRRPGDTHCRLVAVTEGLVLFLPPNLSPFQLLTSLAPTLPSRCPITRL
jgi:hypothetical protein